MKIATLGEVRKELKTLESDELLELCLKLARYKKENKELLNYLLFEAHDESSFVANIKDEMYEGFENMNTGNLYLAKKTIRKILRLTKKYIKYSGNKQTTIELLIFFCQQLRQRCNIKESKVLVNMYDRQLLIIDKALGSLHEDLQYDYEEALNELRKFRSSIDHF
ncbi:hypothetical protein QQ008_24445 [Fulvivirgaceae bacterium BMA10]|uniref:Uncharacterized protein n=1 Tax=Splendidivirga corallicola TaxID=3051826 RepID=A0ABT8KUW9_9BACT|nr:hypothetical protein [Fulvivirgaceae bacterium BMA10]